MTAGFMVTREQGSVSRSYKSGGHSPPLQSDVSLHQDLCRFTLHKPLWLSRQIVRNEYGSNHSYCYQDNSRRPFLENNLSNSSALGQNLELSVFVYSVICERHKISAMDGNNKQLVT